jgi:hypothetical protein
VREISMQFFLFQVRESDASAGHVKFRPKRTGMRR